MIRSFAVLFLLLEFGGASCFGAEAVPPASNAALPTPTAAAETLIQFNNGDRLHGEIVGVDGKGEVRLTSPAIKEVMELPVSDISHVLMASHQGLRSNAASRTLVRLINNDELVGSLTSLDREELVLDTWYAGSLRIPRGHVRSVRWSATNQIVYEGPTGLEGWTVTDTKDGQPAQSAVAWKYRDGVFFAKEAGAIARDVKLPDLASIDLDVAWRDFLQLTVTLYTDSLSVYQLSRNVQGPGGAVLNVAAPPQEGAGFYALQLNRNTAYLLTVKKDGQVANSPLDMVPGLELKTKAHIGIRINKEQKTITLLIDGIFVKSWKEPDEFAGQGTAIRLVQQGQALVNISNLKIAHWDGDLGTPGVLAPNMTNDFLQLRNDDNLSGKLEGIRNGQASFTTSFGTLEIPLERVSQIELPVDPKVKVAVPPDAVRARFAGQGTISFRLEDWSRGRITATSPNFGKATFDRSAFERIEFKPGNTP
jgi:hypothetical protein